MELIVISSPNEKPAETESVRRLFNRGMVRFHLRKPSWSLEEVRAYLEKLPKECLLRTVMHRRPELLKEFPLGGYHMSEREPPVERDFEGTLSRSFHDLEELEGNEEDLDYVFLGPIFDSVSKQGYGSAFPPSALRAFFIDRRKRRKVRPRVVALGGMVPDKVRAALSLGFDGVAALGGVWGSRFPGKAFTRYWSAIPWRSRGNDSWLDIVSEENGK